jgi:hypothetical protein
MAPAAKAGERTITAVERRPGGRRRRILRDAESCRRRRLRPVSESTLTKQPNPRRAEAGRMINRCCRQTTQASLCSEQFQAAEHFADDLQLVEQDFLGRVHWIVGNDLDPGRL